MITWIQTSGRGGRPTTQYMAVGVTNSAENKYRRQLCIRFAPLALEDMRLVVGDRLHIGYDEVTKSIVFKRTNDAAGVKLTNSSKSKSIAVVQIGTNLEAHKSIPIDKKSVKHESGHVALFAPELFEPVVSHSPARKLDEFVQIP